MTHHDPHRPEFGYVPDSWERRRDLHAAIDAAAEGMAAIAVGAMRNVVRYGEKPSPAAVLAFRKADAEVTYLRAVRDTTGAPA